jgi:hypothetical protein
MSNRALAFASLRKRCCDLLDGFGERKITPAMIASAQAVSGKAWCGQHSRIGPFYFLR